MVVWFLSNVNCGGGKHDEDNGNDTHDDEDNNCLGKAGDTDCNRGDSMGEVVNSGVNNKSADEIPELEIVHGVLGKLYANSGSDNNDLVLNGDKRILNWIGAVAVIVTGVYAMAMITD